MTMMRTTASRFYYSGDCKLGERICLDAAASQHALKVLRLKLNTPVIIFNNRGGEYHGVIETIANQKAWVALETHNSDDRIDNFPIHLGQALTSHEKMDMIIQKATELGVAEITPLITERSKARIPQDRLHKRMAHWQKVIINACEQCGRNRLVNLHAPQPLSDWVAMQTQLDNKENFIFHFEDDAVTVKQLPPPKKHGCNILIGPEGDFSPKELQWVQRHNWQTLSLGPRILRMETASIAAIAILQSHWG